MIRTCPVCHEPCLWPDTLCACCRKYTTDPHHVCDAVVVLEQWVAADQVSYCDCREYPCQHDQAVLAAQTTARAYVARRREAQGEKP